MLLYNRFLHDYLLTQVSPSPLSSSLPSPSPLLQLRDPHDSWWYQPSPEEERDIDRVMLWSEFQAYCSALSQIGVSACGATALLNVLVSITIHSYELPMWLRFNRNSSTGMSTLTKSIGVYRREREQRMLRWGSTS